LNQFIIRPEQSADVAAITRVTEQAFKAAPHSDHTEQFIVLALRRANALSVSLVAEQEAQVVGHIAFSPVQISDGSSRWYGLGPVSVLPELQRQGIGMALISSGLERLRFLGAAGCVVLGEPSYYGRFGFKNKRGCVLEGVPQEYFLSLEFEQHSAVGKVTYHEAFGAKG
jgi:putative acetyltransferase